jgi:non-ribosomal peptide synthetase component F
VPATVIEQIADRAKAAPDALALDCRGTRVSYGELMARADALAATLAVRPGQRVAVCAPRGIDALTGILAVLRARGAFVPIDVTLPAARIAHQIDDSGAVAVLATPGHAPATGVPVLPLDAADSGPVRSFPEPRDLAYVMYTSGSTGKPKGVEVEHTGLTNYVGWAARTLPRAGASCIRRCRSTSPSPACSSRSSAASRSPCCPRTPGSTSCCPRWSVRTASSG